MTSTPTRRPAPLGVGLAGAALAALAACAGGDRTLGPTTATRPAVATAASDVVVSQVYGGGGNSGATYRNDFIELYNAGTAPVSLGGWSVQYASANGTTWQSTPLSGTIAPGGYYLVREAAGAGGTTPLPAPNDSGGIAMSATAGKVALVRSTAPLTGTGCPIAAPVVDFVGYGTANCFEGSAGTPTLSNTTAALRKGAGRQDTNDNAADFATGAPAPRNGGTATAPTVTVLATPATVTVGGTATLTATVTQNGAPLTPTTIVWTVSPAGSVTLSGQSGATVTATAASAGAATVTATATVDGQPYAGSTTVTVTASATSITVEGYSFRGSDPLPVGFQEFYRVRDPATGTFIRTGITWSSSTPDVATVDALGNVTARGTGTATITATEAGSGRSGTTTVTTTVFALSDTTGGVYADELQFGTPTDATPADEYVVNRATFAASWNRARGQPNWVAYNLDPVHRLRVAADRCDCFTPDPLLPADFPTVTTADYDGSGYSRGHLTMSNDRTRGALDNATTFYYTNIIPQTTQNNGGPWLGLEQFLGDLAVGSNKEIFIIAGGARYSGTLNNAGRVAIPTRTWKVAVILDRDRGIADVRSASDVRVIAVDVPNTTTIPQATADWPKYQVSVDSIERLTGYDVLSALPDDIEALVEAQAPATRAVAMELQPGRVSLTATAVVNVALLSGTDYDAAAVAAADVRLVTATGTAVAPIARGGVVNTSVRDLNGDGKPDRLIGFSTSALRDAGFAPATPALVLRPLGATPAWQATDVTPPEVVP